MGKTAVRGSPVTHPHVRGIFPERQLGLGVTLRSEPNRPVQVPGRHAVDLIIRGRVFFCESDVPLEPCSRVDGATLATDVIQKIEDTSAGLRQGLLRDPERGRSFLLHAPLDVFEQVDDLTRA